MAQRRRRREEEPENHERWLVSYADFITLLFAFFVVMYSISSVNDGKYRVLSNTLTEAFVTSTQSLDPIQIGDPVLSTHPEAGEYVSDQGGSGEQEDITESTEETLPDIEAPPLALAEITDKLENILAPFVDEELVDITQTDDGIEVEMSSKMLFTSGSARLSGDALKALRNIAKVIAPIPNRILVEGHTDNIPIKTPSFPSNWELSAARAASVVHLFSKQDVAPTRMAAIGYGEFQPREDNSTLEGRQTNRRVALIILSKDAERGSSQLDSEQLGADQ
ncbi:MAG: flagellar motor protein MotD [Gammaproteobacteria bacterium]|nr:flagellar motor protein MotD [Gammaproteobacteria bacterium]